MGLDVAQLVQCSPTMQKTLGLIPPVQHEMGLEAHAYNPSIERGYEDQKFKVIFYYLVSLKQGYIHEILSLNK